MTIEIDGNFFILLEKIKNFKFKVLNGNKIEIYYKFSKGFVNEMFLTKLICEKLNSEKLNIILEDSIASPIENGHNAWIVTSFKSDLNEKREIVRRLRINKKFKVADIIEYSIK